jgi:hypothetical protein
LNPRPFGPQPNALPLRYTPNAVSGVTECCPRFSRLKDGRISSISDDAGGPTENRTPLDSFADCIPPRGIGPYLL